MGWTIPRAEQRSQAPSICVSGAGFNTKMSNPKSRTHQDVFDDIGKRITLKKDPSLGRDSWEMRCADTFYRSYLLLSLY